MTIHAFTLKALQRDGLCHPEWPAGVMPPKTGARRQAAAPLSPATASIGQPGTFNGVDQQTLQACLDDDPDTCLTSVPGLAECVTTVRICNAAALSADSNTDDSTTDADVTAADIRDRAATAFDVPSDTLAVDPPAVPAGQQISRLVASGSGEAAWTVTSTHSTPGLQHTDQRFDGFTARYSARTGELLEACWGDLCEAS